MHNYIIILVLALLCQSCLVTRTASPALSGHVYDAKTKQPLEGCLLKLNGSNEPDAVTNEEGYYLVEQVTYREFTWIGMEAPRISSFLLIDKPGYEQHPIRLESPYGAYPHKLLP